MFAKVLFETIFGTGSSELTKTTIPVLDPICIEGTLTFRTLTLEHVKNIGTTKSYIVGVT